MVEATLPMNFEREESGTKLCRVLGAGARYEDCDLRVICEVNCIYGFEKDNGYCPYDGDVPRKFREIVE